MTPTLANNRASALCMIFLTTLFGLREWGVAVPSALIQITALLGICFLAVYARITRKAFVAAGLGLVLWLALAGQDWLELSRQALEKAAFIAAFFTALSTLRNVAETAPGLRRAGRFLAAQPPGRRYAALTGGGHLFALVINYGALSLLGGLATQSAGTEQYDTIRTVRMRRMLLAIQRGFIASLPWSPLAFAMAITTAVIPGASWAGAVLPGLGSAAIILVTGWAMDSIFKPRIANPPERKPVEGSWALLSPLFLLLVILAITVLGLHFMLEIRVVGVVMVVVPCIALIWAVLQHLQQGGEAALSVRARGYIDRELPAFRGELVLLMMAGFIGTVGAPLLQPLVLSTGLDLGALPAWVVLALLVWLVPLLGQLGMNPILAVTLIAPLVPDPATLGVAPAALVAAIAAGWALSGATSPFTATTLLVGAFAGVSASHVGLRWNGAYFLVTATLLTLWIVGFALWL